MKKAPLGIAAVAGVIIGAGVFAAMPVNNNQHGYDPKLTPGVVDPSSYSTLCTTSTKLRRNVSYATKIQVFNEYHIKSHSPGQYEVDHLVPLELGGSNDIRNLWPEPAPGFHTKDALENQLHADVCAGRKTLKQAQQDVVNGVK